MPESRAVCVFRGQSITALRDALAEYPGDDTYIRVTQHGTSYTLVVCNAQGEGEPINDSHPCPGSPGCSE